jgi:hypothetical protein
MSTTKVSAAMQDAGDSKYDQYRRSNWMEVQPSIRNVNEGGVITAFPGGIPTQAEQDLWTAEYEAYLPTKAWKQAMAGTDAIPRWAEEALREIKPV